MSSSCKERSECRKVRGGGERTAGTTLQCKDKGMLQTGEELKKRRIKENKVIQERSFK